MRPHVPPSLFDPGKPDDDTRAVSAGPDTAQAPQAQPPNQSPAEISRLAEHLFRHEAGKLVSVLTSLLGIQRLQLAEDVVQEALARALQTWPYYGLPTNPAAWLTQTAKNLALDVIRREKLFADKQPQIISFIEQWTEDCDPADSPAFATEIHDGRLRLMFACCHPEIAPDDQAALALKTLCGFSPVEIARAFLTTEVAVAKRLTRARQRIRDLDLPFEIPAGDDLAARLDGVLRTVYLLFNEGYTATSGDHLIRHDLCHEAIRLATLLATHPVTGQPRAHALAALLLFNGARLNARVDPEGHILRLQDQDRSRWNPRLIQHGFWHLAQSARGDEVGTYHLQAAIAACHAAAPRADDTDWPRILALYDELLRLEPSPVAALNRAVAVAEVHGPQAGLEAIQAIAPCGPLEAYHLFHAVQAEFHLRLGRRTEAAAGFRRALEIATLASERQWLASRLATCEA